MKKKIVVLMLGCLMLQGCFGWHYSDGDRVGVVRKFSKKGLFIKTWEGELIMNMTADDNGVIVPDIFNFSIHVDNPNQETLAKEFIKAMDEGKRVRLHYDQQLYVFNFKGDTSHFITKIEFIDDKGK